MMPVLILLAILAVTGVIAYLLERRQRRAGETPVNEDGEENKENKPASNCNTEDCAIGSICPSQEILRNHSDRIEYYDDEELDRFAGRGAADYSDDETEQWRDILYTLKPDDRMGWAHSLQQRGITMPAVIRDEFIMLAQSTATAK